MHIDFTIPQAFLWACGGGCSIGALLLGLGAFLSNKEHRKIQARLAKAKLEHQYPPPVNPELDIEYYPPIDQERQ